MHDLKLKRIILSLLVIAVFAVPGCAQRSVQGQGTQSEWPQMTVKGKIDFMKNLGGYFVRSLEPGGEFFIINQDPKLLDELMKSGKTLTIQGRINLALGAEYMFIEKIDGKAYRGKMK